MRTIWLAEGLVNYIPEAGLRTLLSSVAEVGAPDTLAMVHGTPHCPTACRHRAAHSLAGRVHLQAMLVTPLC